MHTRSERGLLLPNLVFPGSKRHHAVDLCISEHQAKIKSRANFDPLSGAVCAGFRHLIMNNDAVNSGLSTALY